MKYVKLLAEIKKLKVQLAKVHMLASEVETMLAELVKTQKLASDMRTRLEDANDELAKLKEDMDKKYTKDFKAAGDSYEIQVNQIAKNVF